MFSYGIRTFHHFSVFFLSFFFFLLFWRRVTSASPFSTLANRVPPSSKPHTPYKKRERMAARCQFEHSSDVGVFARLTNKYAIVSQGGADHFKVLESELQDKIPVVRTSLANTRVVGRLCVGNRHGLLVPNTTTNQGWSRLV